MTSFHRIRSFAAGLALAGLLALHLHVLMHVLGIDNDDDGKPCQICQMVLHQQALEAVAPVAGPTAPAWILIAVQAQPASHVCVEPLCRQPRGPPALITV